VPRKRTELLDFLDSVSYLILQALIDGSKSFTELFNVSKLSKRNFDKRIKELIDLKLITEVLVLNEKTGRKKKKYALTDIGKRILNLLEEIEKVYTEGVKEDKGELESLEFTKKPEKEIHEAMPGVNKNLFNEVRKR